MNTRRCAIDEMVIVALDRQRSAECVDSGSARVIAQGVTGVRSGCQSPDRRWFTGACGRMVVGVVAAEEDHGEQGRRLVDQESVALPGLVSAQVAALDLLSFHGALWPHLYCHAPSSAVHAL
jgi:hypothetical protein